MRAVIAEKHGGPEVLRPADIDTPTPGPGQLLVDVAAAGVNFADIYRRQGHPPYAGDVPYVAGSEGAGTVTAAGPGAGRVGDRVAWTDVSGSYAEQVLVPADRAVLVPDGVDLEVAAAVMLQGLTAHYLVPTPTPWPAATRRSCTRPRAGSASCSRRW
jgi:NADPH:quinone reductase